MSDWPYAVEPAPEAEQAGALGDRQLKMLGEDGNVYAGERAREMIEFAAEVPDQPRWIGVTERDQQDVSLPYDLLFRHMFVGGQTGMGKSTLLKNLVQQHIYAGKGVCFIDPKGDDVLDILQCVPRERWDDVIFIAPGEDALDRQIGFNLLDTYTDPGDNGFDAEVEGIVGDIKALLAADDFWGPRMDGVASNMLRGMLRHEFDFTLADMFGALLDEENREEYANLIKASDEDLAFIEGYTQKIAELEDTDLDAIRRRLKDWVEVPTMRQIVAQRDAQVSIPEAVEDEKIILVKNDLPEEPQQAVATAILRQVWTAVNSRRSERESLMENIAEADDGGTGEFAEDAVEEAIEEYTGDEANAAAVDADYSPYFLVIDEAHDVLTDASKIEKMLAKARSKRLGLTIASQQLRQLDEDAQDAVLGNCNTVIAYDAGHPAEARTLATRFGEKGKEDLQEIDQYHAWMRTAVEAGQRSPPFLAEAFPPYPPLHGVKDLYRLIRRSLDQYGVEPPSSEEVQKRLHFSAAEAGSEDEVVLSDAEATLVAKAAYDEALRREDTAPEWVPVEDPETRRRVARYLPETEVGHVSQLWNVIDHVPDSLLDVTERDGEMVMRCTERGVSRIFETGSASSAGGGKHRALLKDAYRPLFRAGLVVEIPTQTAGDMPDAVASLTDATELDLDLAEATPAEAAAVREEFREERPLLDRLAVPDALDPIVTRQAQGPPVTVEAESTTGESKPAQTLFNLAQAVNAGRRCLFVVRENVAPAVWETLVEPYADRGDGETRWYNGGELVIGDETMLRPAEGRETVWLYDEAADDYVLRDSTGTDLARFEQASDVFTDAAAYPATTASADLDSPDWRPVYRPFIPAYHFDGVAERSAWDIVIVPSEATHPDDLRLYRGPDRPDVPLPALVGEQSTSAPAADPPAQNGAEERDEPAAGEELDQQEEQSGDSGEVVVGEEEKEQLRDVFDRLD